jgi:predicted SnoaL-like aldol condensation-catalyzing enzyme
MKAFLSLLAAAGLALVGTAPAAAQMRALSDPVTAHPDPESLFTSTDPKLHKNKQASLRIMRELLQCNQWSRAGEWLTDAYIQHNPVAASGLPGVIYYFTEIAKRQPTATCDKLTSPVVAVQAEGDYVTVLTVRTIPYADDPSKSYTTTWFDTWRFVDGKADEHWDPMELPSGPPPQAAAPADPAALAMRIKDREEIDALMWSYDRALDTYNADGYAAKFTPDGAFGQIKGRAALHKMIADLKTDHTARRAKGESLGTMRHFTMNQNLQFTGPTTAKFRYYHQTVFGTGGPLGEKSGPTVAAAGIGVDDLVKVDGKWLIASRDVVGANE